LLPCAIAVAQRANEKKRRRPFFMARIITPVVNNKSAEENSERL